MVLQLWSLARSYLKLMLEPRLIKAACARRIKQCLKQLLNSKIFSFKYDSQAKPTLKQINLTIKQGEKLLIAGPSGSGKSTIGRCINGLIPNLDTGEITGECTINGKNIKDTNLFDLSFTTSTILQDTDSQFIGLNCW